MKQNKTTRPRGSATRWLLLTMLALTMGMGWSLEATAQTSVICPQCGGDGEYEPECPDCGGSGSIDEYCSVCSGTGGEDVETGDYDDDGEPICDWVECSSCGGDGTVSIDCVTCGGDGHLDPEECDRCGGTGYLSAYTVTITPPTNGTVIVANTEYLAGETVTLIITPDRGYKPDVILVKDANDAVVGLTGMSFTMPASNVTVSVTFREKRNDELDDITLTYLRSSSDGACWGDGAPGNLLDCRADTKWGCDIDAFPVTYVFKSSLPIIPTQYMLTPGGDTGSGCEDRSWYLWKIYGAYFTDDAAATDNAAGWVLLDEKSDYTLDHSSPEALNLSVANSKPYTHFKIVLLATEGGCAQQMAEFAFTNYSAPLTWDVTYKLGTKVLKEDIVARGENIVTPAFEGYTISGWYTDAALTSPMAFPYQPTADITLYADGSVNSYALSVATPANGTLSASHNGTVDFGTTVTVTATPATGYYLTGITVTDASSNVVASKGYFTQATTNLTFTMPANAVTVSATFQTADAGKAAVITTASGATTFYDDFDYVADAFIIDEVADGSTLTLLDDVTTNGFDIYSKNITLDLGGKTLTATDDGVLTINGCNFTLTDSGTGGTIDATGHYNSLHIYGANVTIEGGTVKADDSAIWLEVTTASCTITGGTFTALSGNSSVYVANGTLTITGGTYTGMVFNDAGNVTISGGTITKVNDLKCAHNDKGTMTISGGKFTGEVYNDTDNNATTTISGGYFSEDPTAGAYPATVADGCTLVSESGVVGYPYAVKKSLNLLNDDSGAAKTNSQLLAENNGNLRDVTLSGRKLTKDGSWNTLCLPFSLTAEQIAASQLSEATIKELDNTEGTGSNLADNGTLTLVFKDAASIEAGKPYIVKWASGADIVNPVFTGVTITATTPTAVEFSNGVGSDDCQFVGQFSNFAIDADNINQIVMLGANNQLGYSKNARELKAFRAHFLIPTEGTSNARAISSYVIDFGEESTAIRGTEFTEPTEGTEAVYTLQGIRIEPSAMQRGQVYIVGGKKVVKK